MKKKSTEDLEKTLENVHTKDFDTFLENNKEHMMTESETFSVYVKELFKQKGTTQQKVFLEADIPERYGYKLLSGEKRTKQRDIIYRICYAAHFTLEETQESFKKYEMPELYVKIPRDALLMIMLNERPGSIIDVNALLKEKGMESLRTSGMQE